MPVALQQSLEPHHVPAGFHSHYRSCRQAGVELLHLLTQMLDPTIRQHFAACALDHEHLLSTRMKITAYNQHRLAPFARTPWSLANQKSTGVGSRRRYQIKARCWPKDLPRCLYLNRIIPALSRVFRVRAWTQQLSPKHSGRSFTAATIILGARGCFACLRSG